MSHLATFPGRNPTNLAYLNKLYRNSNCLFYQWDWYESRPQQCQGLFPSSRDILCCLGFFRQFLDSDVRQRVGRKWINPLTALGFVFITRSSIDVFSFVSAAIASSFSGHFWMQLVFKKFVQPTTKLMMMLTSDVVFVELNFQGMGRGNQAKHPDDIVRNQPLWPSRAMCGRHVYHYPVSKLVQGRGKHLSRKSPECNDALSQSDNRSPLAIASRMTALLYFTEALES